MSIRSLFADIADAIKEKNTSVDTVTPGEMPQAIRDIETGSGFYVPTIHFYNQFRGNSGNNSTYTHSGDSINATLLIIWVQGDINVKDISTNVRVELNGDIISMENIYPDTNNNILLNYAYTDLTLGDGDILTADVLTTYANSGLFMIILDKVSSISSYGNRGNQNGYFELPVNTILFQAARFGFYSNNNTLAQYGLIYHYTTNNMGNTYTLGNSIATPNQSAYWYGGTLVMTITP